ncbi:MAG: glycerol-3-phosphate dehydrogenase/oxidase [Gammaproteobacteria bacterium]|nr:glycerol-3-phosphate dehydrogenase/oxidase [Gammaproteobacteria bacterium]
MDAAAVATRRDTAFAALAARTDPFDLVVIGAGATGAAIALEAASRGLTTALFERGDFGQGTSSRSSKLIHGGVRYLAQGRIALVRESLRERARLLANAPHVVHRQAFVAPCDGAFDWLRLRAGLGLYDRLAGDLGIGATATLDATALRARLPTLSAGARHGVRYFDACFDDARLLWNIVETAIAHGAVAINYAPVVALRKDGRGRVGGVVIEDAESGQVHEIAARTVVAAAGADADTLLRMDDANAVPGVTPSQGAHVVVAREFLPGEDALLMPRTPDGRVMFAIPWQQHVLIGTTDTAVGAIVAEPLPLAAEIDLILDTAARYLARAPGRADILSTFAGIRPLARPPRQVRSARISREHRIDVTDSGLVTITGGKWTTCRLMAEQCVDVAARVHGLDAGLSRSADLRLSAAPARPAPADPLGAWGIHAGALAALARERTALAAPMHTRFTLPLAACAWAARHEMARTLEDVLARRTRLLFVDARAAAEAAPAVAAVIAAELGRDSAWQRAQIDHIVTLAARYLP